MYIYAATVRKPDAAARASLTDFGKYVAECLPKYVQKVQLTAGDELEVLVAPEGVIPILQFLKDHHTAQFANLVDIAGMDVPSRKYRFEVICLLLSLWWKCLYNEYGIYFRSYIIYCHCDSIPGFELKPIQTN